MSATNVEIPSKTRAAGEPEISGCLLCTLGPRENRNGSENLMENMGAKESWRRIGTGLVVIATFSKGMSQGPGSQ